LKPFCDVYYPISEAIFVEEICALLPGFLGRRAATMEVEREVAVGNTIADLVVMLERDSCQPRMARPLTVAESVMLSLLRRNGPLLPSEIESRLGSNGKTMQIIENLAKQGMITSARSGHVLTKRCWWGARTLVAVEVKLLRWREALLQARSYRRYADEVYVALPEVFAAPAISAVENFRKYGVGLFIVSESGIRTIAAAKKSREHDWRREFVYSRLISRKEDDPDVDNGFS